MTWWRVWFALALGGISGLVIALAWQSKMWRWIAGLVGMVGTLGLMYETLSGELR